MTFNYGEIAIIVDSRTSSIENRSLSTLIAVKVNGLKKSPTHRAGLLLVGLVHAPVFDAFWLMVFAVTLAVVFGVVGVVAFKEHHI